MTRTHLNLDERSVDFLVAEASLVAENYALDVQSHRLCTHNNTDRIVSNLSRDQLSGHDDHINLPRIHPGQGEIHKASIDNISIALCNAAFSSFTQFTYPHSAANLLEMQPT